MRQISSLLRSVARLTRSRRTRHGGLPLGEPRPRAAKPLHIAVSVASIARHRRAAISVLDAREVIRRLAATPWPTRAERELSDDLVSATGLQLDELAELTKEWLPW